MYSPLYTLNNQHVDSYQLTAETQLAGGGQVFHPMVLVLGELYSYK